VKQSKEHVSSVIQNIPSRISVPTCLPLVLPLPQSGTGTADITAAAAAFCGKQRGPRHAHLCCSGSPHSGTASSAASAAAATSLLPPGAKGLVV